MEFLTRTDLALEGVPKGSSVEGKKDYEVNSYSLCGFDTVEVKIKSKAGEGLLKRKIGSYITIATGGIYSDNEKSMKRAINACASTIRSLIERKAPECCSFLVVGLGNKFITSDALGPICVDKMTENGISRRKRLSIIAPGVPAQSGIETHELIKCALNASGAGCLILIDALASRSLERLCSTVQISDTGLCPGSGTGTIKQEISEESVGVPIISIGVPTVVSLSNIFYDAFEASKIEKVPTRVYNLLKSYAELFVSPKDIDVTISAMSSLIARSIEIAIKRKSAT